MTRAAVAVLCLLALQASAAHAKGAVVVVPRAPVVVPRAPAAAQRPAQPPKAPPARPSRSDPSPSPAAVAPWWMFWAPAVHSEQSCRDDRKAGKCRDE